MKNFLILFGLLVMGFFFHGCEKAKVETDLLIKVKNISPYAFQEVLVNTSGGEQIYGRIEANSESEYKPFEFAYRYAYVKAVIDGEEYILQPIDYVGEKRLDPGKYTYVLNADNSTDQYGRLQI